MNYGHQQKHHISPNERTVRLETAPVSECFPLMQENARTLITWRDNEMNPISEAHGEERSRVTATHLNAKHSSKQVNGESARTQTGKILEVNARRHQK